MRCTWYVLVTTGFLATLALTAASAPQATAEENGSLEGIVIDSKTGARIPEAQIRLTGGSVDPAAFERLKASLSSRQIAVPAPGDLAPDELIEAIQNIAVASGTGVINPQLPVFDAFRSANDARFQVQSDSEGRFTIRNIPPGRYKAQVQREGYGSLGAVTAAAVVTVAANRTTTVTVAATPGGTIAGRVTRNGIPQSEMPVQAFAMEYQNGYPVLRSVAIRKTDDRGQYRLYDLPPGDYMIATMPRDTFPQIEDVARASTPWTLDSTVPIERVRTFYPGTIDSAAAEVVSIRNGGEVSAVDIPLQSAALGRIMGEVRVPARPADTRSAVSGMVSFALDGAPEIPRGPGDFGGVSGVTLQRAGNLFVGRFRASDIPPGGYQWVVEIRDQRQPLEGTAITTSVDVRGGDMELRFDLPAAALALTGAVTLNGEAPKADKVRIWLQLDGASAKTDTYQKLAERFVLADNKTGAFSIPSVPLGHFHVMVGGPLPRDVYIEDVRSGNKSVFDAGFDIDTGEIPRLDIRLRAGGGSISGTVGDTQGKPVAGASVALVPASRESRGNPARFHSVTSDVDGKFNIASVAPGEYKLFAWSVVPSGAWFNATFLSRFEDKGTHVTVSRQSSSVTTELTTLTTAKP